MADLDKQQHLHLNASVILNQIYMAESAVLRAEKSFYKDSVEAAMAKLNLYKATEKIMAAAKEGIISFAEGDEQRMMLVGLRRFTKMDPFNVKDARQRVAQKLIQANKYIY